MIKSKFVTVGVMALAFAALAGCQTTSVDQAIQSSLPKVCTAAEVAHAGFLVVVEAGKVSEKDAAVELAAYQSLQAPCSNPGAQNTATVLVAAANAYMTIAKALREAEAENGE